MLQVYVGAAYAPSVRCAQTFIMSNIKLEKYGPPDIKLSGFQLWIHNRQYPESDDYWDGNWLRATAHCGSDGASVTVTGAIIRSPEVLELKKAFEQLSSSLQGAKQIECLEPYLKFDLQMESLGNTVFSVFITPDHLTQQHSFIFSIDQSYFSSMIESCTKILKRFPIIGDPSYSVGRT